MMADPHLSLEEYLELERNSEGKHEYMAGEVVSVRGGSPQHSLISANLCVALGKRLAGGKCRVFDSSLRVCLDFETSFYVYPDLTVVEGAVECLEDRNETVVNPKLVVEVLSPASRNVDLGSKARMYTRVASLTDLLIVDQDRMAVEHWTRGAGGHWDVVQVTDGEVAIVSLGCGIPMGEIYAGVNWPNL